MDIEVTPKDKATIVRLTGRIIDGDPAKELSIALRDLTRDKGHVTIFDLEAVTWFDSVAIGLFVGHYISVSKGGGKVILVNADKKIQTLMRMTFLEDKFEWAQEVDEALRSLEGTS